MVERRSFKDCFDFEELEGSDGREEGAVALDKAESEETSAGLS